MYIFGRNPVLEALRGDREIEKIFIRHGAEDSGTAQIRSEAQRRSVACVIADTRKFGAMERELKAGMHAAQGVIALVSPVPRRSLVELIDLAYERSDNPVLAALDGISDPHNLGAIARSAECAGIHGLIIPERGGAPITNVALKTAAGAFEHLPVAKVGPLEKALIDCRNADFRIVGCADAGAEDYDAVDYDGPQVIVIGSEGAGISAPILKMCDVQVRVPMAGKISSLNASVAAGVMFFEILRRRRHAEKPA